ncbi:hypothetical protein KC845_00715 [Candidatus Kaiserbacteria bacterium]|nr:hypothetical protein [Candidatus Kaiserbacteria bacterium]
MNQDDKRLAEAERERTRLQNLNVKLIQEISLAQKNKINVVAEIRRKAENDIHEFERKADRDIEKLEHDQKRLENLLRSNNITIMNLEREMENKRRTNQQ